MPRRKKFQHLVLGLLAHPCVITLVCALNRILTVISRIHDRVDFAPRSFFGICARDQRPKSYFNNTRAFHTPLSLTVQIITVRNRLTPKQLADVDDGNSNGTSFMMPAVGTLHKERFVYFMLSSS